MRACLRAMESYTHRPEFESATTSVRILIAWFTTFAPCKVQF